MGTTISIIIACTRPEMARRSVDKLVRQLHGTDGEVIVVGDVAGLERRGEDAHVVLIPCDDRHPNVRRNLGLSRATGSRIAFLDDDAVPREGWLKAALELDPEGSVIFTGPEYPVEHGKVSRMVYSVCRNVFTEGDRAHYITRRMDIAWTEVPFCNIVIPRRLFDRVGLPAVDIPWDMDDTEFCFRIRRRAIFQNVPGLAIFHDRYPNSVARFLHYKWRRRLRTGEKLVAFPHIHVNKIPVVAGAGAPWLFAVLLAVLPVPPRESIGMIGLCYLAALVVQGRTAYREEGWRWLIPCVALMVTVQIVSTVAVQVGLVRGFLRRDGRTP